MVTFEREYQIRRAVCRITPTSYEPDSPPHLIHCCAWKTGSQWIRLVLSDPRIYRYTGLQPYPYATVRDDQECAKKYKRSKRTILLASYDSYETAKSLAGKPNVKSFFVIRDPRTMLVSWYYSTRFTHRPTTGVDEHRYAMQNMSDRDAFIYCSDAFIKEFAPILDSWAQHANNLPIVHFEDLTGVNSSLIWTNLFAELGYAVPQETIQKVLKTYSIENLAPNPHARNVDDKYAAKGKREWPTFLSGSDTSSIYQQLETWIQAFGYTTQHA
nr:sulfotransferase domain-containing protein [Marivivens donghaensis]